MPLAWRFHPCISLAPSRNASADAGLDPTGQSIASPASRLGSLNQTMPRTRSASSSSSTMCRIQALLLPPFSVEATSASRNGRMLFSAMAQ